MRRKSKGEFFKFLEALSAELDPDLHAHKCPCCGEVWEHKRSELGDAYGAWERAHSCPKCGHHGEGCTLHYEATDPARYERGLKRLRERGCHV